MITMNVDADTYLRWLSEIADLWSEKGQEPSIVRRRNSGVSKVPRSEAATEGCAGNYARLVIFSFDSKLDAREV